MNLTLEYAELCIGRPWGELAGMEAVLEGGRLVVVEGGG